MWTKTISNWPYGYLNNSLVGSGQVVRHMVLVHAFGGSNPSSPATLEPDYYVRFLRGYEMSGIRTGAKVFAPRYFARLIEQSESLLF